MGALAPRRRQPEVYRRRRIALVVVLTLLIALPWCVSRAAVAARTPRATILRRPRPRTCAATTAELPLRSRLAMTLMIGVDGDDPDAVLALLESPTRPGGVFVRGGTAIWDDRTLVTPLGDDLPLLVAVDDEGGRVQPMEGVLGELASAAALAGESVGVDRVGGR